MLPFKQTVSGVRYMRLFHQNLALCGSMRGVFIHASLEKAKELRRTRALVLAVSIDV